MGFVRTMNFLNKKFDHDFRNSFTYSRSKMASEMTSDIKNGPFALDLSKLRPTESFSNYQKLWSNDESSENINALYVCIFCNEPISPRCKVNVIRKKPKDLLDSPHSVDPGLNSQESVLENPLRTVQGSEPVIEYSCSQCSNKIRSYTVSPRNAVMSPPSPVFTPRPKPGFTRSQSLVKGSFHEFKRSPIRLGSSSELAGSAPSCTLRQSWSNRESPVNTPDIQENQPQEAEPKVSLPRRNTDCGASQGQGHL